MPNIQSAKKKMRQDKKRTARNDSYRKGIKNMVKSFLKLDSKDRGAQIKKAHASIDKAAKRKIIHKNKAARLKSRISKLASKK